MTSTEVMSRRVASIYAARRDRYGDDEDGPVVVRVLYPGALPDAKADPFLLIEHLGREGQPQGKEPPPRWLPFRGTDMLTYVRKGAARYQDTMGTFGVLRDGDAQWARAGSGVIRDEVVLLPRETTGEAEARNPAAPEGGVLRVWVNVPAGLKGAPPCYFTAAASAAPWVSLNECGSTGTTVKRLAGRTPEKASSTSDATGATPPVFRVDALGIDVCVVDIDIRPGGVCMLPIPSSMKTVIGYIYSGKGRVRNGSRDAAGAAVSAGDVVVFASDDAGYIHFSALEDDEYLATNNGDSESITTISGCMIFVVAGAPCHEPVVRAGPFAMESDAELQRAFDDYAAGTLATTAPQEERLEEGC